VTRKRLLDTLAERTESSESFAGTGRSPRR
jgi:hypothetical protein